MNRFSVLRLCAAVFALVVTTSFAPAVLGLPPEALVVLDHLLDPNEPAPPDYNGDSRIDCADLTWFINTQVEGSDQLRLTLDQQYVSVGSSNRVKIDLLDGEGLLINPGVPGGVTSGDVDLQLVLTGPAVFPANGTQMLDSSIKDILGSAANIMGTDEGAVTMTANVITTSWDRPGNPLDISAQVSYSSVVENQMTAMVTLDGMTVMQNSYVHVRDRINPRTLLETALTINGTATFNVPTGSFDFLFVPPPFYDDSLVPECFRDVDTSKLSLPTTNLAPINGNTTVRVMGSGITGPADVDLWYFNGSICDRQTVYTSILDLGEAVYADMIPGRALVRVLDFGRMDANFQPYMGLREVDIPESGEFVINMQAMPVARAMLDTVVKGSLPRSDSEGRFPLLFDADIPDIDRPMEIDARFEYRDFAGRFAGLSEQVSFTLPVGGPAEIMVPQGVIMGPGGEEIFDVRVFSANCRFEDTELSQQGVAAPPVKALLLTEPHIRPIDWSQFD